MRIERAHRTFAAACKVWFVVQIAGEIVSFPRFFFEWYGGAPMALSIAALAFLWAGLALWAGGLQIGPADTRKVITRAYMPGKFWRYVFVATIIALGLAAFGGWRLFQN